MSHTPEPWWCAQSGTTGTKYAVGSGNTEIGWFLKRGDAMLAKAAPDLLAALEAVMRQCEPTMDVELDAMSDEEADAWILARDAIKAAKGE